MNTEQKKHIQNIIKEFKKERIFILEDGEIEDYLPDNHKKLDNMIELMRPEILPTWNNGKRLKLEKIINDVLENILNRNTFTF